MYTYLWCFFVFAFLGWCGEVVFAAVREKRFVNRGFLNGPLCPIYGLGVVLIDLCLRPVGFSIPVLLIGSMIVGSALEWLAGFLLEKLFHQKWWDYSDQPHNLNGYICLRFSILWAFAGMVVINWIMPLSRLMISKIPRTLGWILLGILLALVLADFCVTVASIVGINRKLKNLEYVSGKLKTGSDRLGESLFNGAMAAEAKRAELEKDWQREAARLKEKYEENLRVNPMHRRLLKAFPDLRSLQHNKELEALRQNVAGFQRKSKEVLERRNAAAAAVYEERPVPGKENPFACGLCFSKLFWVFMLGNVVGFVLETIYAFIVPPHQFEMRTSVVFGPFILVYGFGAVVITLLLFQMYNQRDSLIFIASMVIGGAFEYLCSFLQQSVFGTVSWEYSDSPLNISGRTNLMYSFFWGVLGLLWVKDLYPVISRQIQRIPKKVGRPLTVCVAVFMVVDMALSAGAVFRQSQRINGIPAENPVQVFFDRFFPDEYLEFIYPHMEYVGKPDIVKNEPPLPPNQD